MNGKQMAALMVAAQGGDSASFAVLLHACVPLIRFVGAGVGVGAVELDDLVQDVLLSIHRARQTYDSRQPFIPWLRTIAQRRAIDIRRRAGRLHERELHEPGTYGSHPDPAPTAAQAVQRVDEDTQLRVTVAQLPDAQREAIELLGLQELSLDEAAGITGRTKNALKVNLHRALKSLRRRLEQNA